MRSELSEFSYGFALTAELRDFFRPWVVEPPVFPTLRREAQLGWDVKFPVVGRSLFLQFKVADALTRPSASEWAHYNALYYRFPLHRISNSDQHNLLRTLSGTEPFVFYVAPRFYRLEEFTQRYSTSAVCRESAWIALSGLPTITDNGQHHITYRNGVDARFASPDAERIDNAFDGERLTAYVRGEWNRQRKTLTLDTFVQLRSELLGILRRTRSRAPELPTAARRFQVFRDIAFISRTFFGAEFLLLHER